MSRTESSKRHKPILTLALVALAVSGSALLVAAQSQAPKKAGDSPVERGKFLVMLGGCNNCHTPLTMGPNGPAPDMSRMLSGHPESLKMPAAPAMAMPWMVAGSATMTAYAGPWGISYASNLTPDSVTGMAIWTEEMFLKAMRTGKHMATSRPIMPPMPWQTLSMLSDADLKAIYAFLKTIPPIHNQVPVYQPPPGQK